mmetsp:Transcript_10866/g.26652  ORF Transcript_10866/g.26652 Transcript_10866/m.26652 type:complete len:227 (-) Transcript_10866:2100-2780(-)
MQLRFLVIAFGILFRLDTLVAVGTAGGALFATSFRRSNSTSLIFCRIQLTQHGLEIDRRSVRRGCAVFHLRLCLLALCPPAFSCAFCAFRAPEKGRRCPPGRPPSFFCLPLNKFEQPLSLRQRRRKAVDVFKRYRQAANYCPSSPTTNLHFILVVVVRRLQEFSDTLRRPVLRLQKGAPLLWLPTMRWLAFLETEKLFTLILAGFHVVDSRRVVRGNPAVEKGDRC